MKIARAVVITSLSLGFFLGIYGKSLAGIAGYPCYRTVEETFSTAEAIVADHPQLATWIDIGDSWEKSAPGGKPGYDMMVLRLTNAAVSGPKPKLFIISSIQALEITPAELNTRFAEHLMQEYAVNPDVTWILDYHEIHLLLQANPDGRKHAETGLPWRKNTNENYCSPTSNSRGADLNRNFAFQWGCCGASSGSPCDETYRGLSPASEPEVQAIQNYLRSEFIDMRGDDPADPAPDTTTGLFLDLHGYGESIAWPWGFTSNSAPNGVTLQTLGRKLAYFNGYTPAQAAGFYPVDGTSADFAYGSLGLPAYRIELGTAFFQDCMTFESTILPNSLTMLIYAAKVLQAPYKTPSGPDALNVKSNSETVVQGTLVTLNATIDDTRFNNANGTEATQNVAAAQYCIDTPPWLSNPGPTAVAMVAGDGAFDETIEEVEANIDTTDLGAGRHIIFVRGQDSAGNWGPFSAVYLNIANPTAPWLPLLLSDD